MTAADARREVGADDRAVGGEDHAGDHHRHVEGASGEVVERAELREVEGPPLYVACGEDSGQYAEDEDAGGDRAEDV